MAWPAMSIAALSALKRWGGDGMAMEKWKIEIGTTSSNRISAKIFNGKQRRDLPSSMLIGIDTCFVSASITGITRRSSSSTDTSCAPGRVDSPPISKIAAPSAASCNPCAIAASASKCSPPLAKESGVTLTIPITFG